MELRLNLIVQRFLELLVSAGLGRLMDGGGGSGGAASSDGEFQTARRGFVLIFVLHVSCVFFK